jgi:hypothetical protein
LCYFGGIIVTLTLFLFTLKSDQRSTSEKLDRVAEDLSTFSQRLTTIEARLPNKEAEGLRYQVLEQKVAKDRSDWEFAVAKLEKWKEDTTRSLIKKGVID